MDPWPPENQRFRRGRNLGQGSNQGSPFRPPLTPPLRITVFVTGKLETNPMWAGVYPRTDRGLQGRGHRRH